jgi:hypothetical protein
VVSGYQITEALPEGLALQSQSHDPPTIPSSPKLFLPASHIVLCTGHQSMPATTRSIFGDAVVDAVGPIWGLDKEGEVRKVWRPSGVKGFWIVGGNFKAARWGVEALGLLIKAIKVGICTWGDSGCV